MTRNLYEIREELRNAHEQRYWLTKGGSNSSTLDQTIRALERELSARTRRIV